jgi:hypothetical protein
MGKKKTTEQFIEDAIRIHQFKFDYSLVKYEGVKTHVDIICDQGHTFKQSPNDHLNGHGCKICSGWGELKFNPQEFIIRAKSIHGDRYDYSKSVYLDHDSDLIIICQVHGEFLQSPKRHLVHKNGCRKCGYESMADKSRLTKDEFVKKSLEVHFGLYSYDNFNYVSFSTPSYVTCHKHGDFKQSPKDHIIQKQGCPKCRLSKGETIIKNYLDQHQIHYITQKTFPNCINPNTQRKLKFDFYIPYNNMCIEFDGEQHYKQAQLFRGKLEEIQFRDNLKNIYCKEKNIPLLRIKYLDIGKIDSI